MPSPTVTMMTKYNKENGDMKRNGLDRTRNIIPAKSASRSPQYILVYAGLISTVSLRPDVLRIENKHITHRHDSHVLRWDIP